LDPGQRTAFNLWRTLGLSEEASLRVMQEDGWLPPSSGGDQLVESFKRLGLSDAAAEIAADGPGGPRRRHVAESREGAAAQEDNRRRLIEQIERLAFEMRQGGYTLCVERGQTREEAALQAAYYKVFGLASDDGARLWVMKVAEERWPWLVKSSRSTGGGHI
jgi:hypothetical protein